MTGVVHVKHGSTWKSVNFGAAQLWVKHSGTWKEPTAAYVKHSGSWKKVYPSDLEAWTTAGLPTGAYRQVTNNPPNLSTNILYQYSNLVVAGGDVRWEDRAADTGQWVRGWGYGWTPATTAGFVYGAVTRIEVTFDARYIDTPGSGHYFRLSVRPQTGSTAFETANLTSTRTVYTFDKTVAEWGLTAAEAGALHLSPSESNSIQLAAVYNNSTAGSDQEIEIEDLQCRIKYLYN